MVPLEKIYEKYYSDIYHFILALSQDAHVAEDISQETFMKAMSAINTFKGDCDIKNWLFQIAKNTYFTYIKRKKREVPDGEEQLENMVSDCDFVKKAIDEDQAMRIHQILHKLQEPYKEVFHLRVFGELSFQQIASIYGKTESWARVTYHRARIMIMQALDK